MGQQGREGQQMLRWVGGGLALVLSGAAASRQCMQAAAQQVRISRLQSAWEAGGV
jgi:hypothetical protein